MHFPEDELDELAESIDEVGVLVPISVYRDEGDPERPYVLLDGERRWRCSTRLGLDAIPAIVMDKPDSTENLLTMFNIHMVREPWDDMPTAWALEKLMERIKEDDPKVLEAKTGLSVEQIRRLQHAISLSKDYQDLIESGEVPLNFFFELNRNVVNLLERKRPNVFEKFGEDAIRSAFVEKKKANVTTDTVELRKMRPIITTAADEAGAADASSDLDEVIEELISVRDRTIQEAYEATVEMVVEADRFARQCDLLIRRFDRLMQRATTPEERELIAGAMNELRRAIDARMPQD